VIPRSFSTLSVSSTCSFFISPSGWSNAFCLSGIVPVISSIRSASVPGGDESGSATEGKGKEEKRTGQTLAVVDVGDDGEVSYPVGRKLCEGLSATRTSDRLYEGGDGQFCVARRESETKDEPKVVPWLPAVFAHSTRSIVRTLQRSLVAVAEL
jgi:hypothetical protein